MFAEIEAFALHLFADTKTDQHLGDVISDRRTNSRPCNGDSHCDDLNDQPRPDRIIIPARTTERRRIDDAGRSEEHTSELQSLMRNSYADFCFKKNITQDN